MSQTHSKDEVTVVVFKGNLASRTFQLPLNWAPRLSLLLGGLLLVTLFSLGLSLKFYRMATHGDPGRVQELELELGNLRASYQQALEGKSAIPSPMDNDPMPPATAAKLKEAEPQDSSVFIALGGDPLLFHGLPESITEPPKDETQIPITIGSPQSVWEGKTLKVQFNLQYTNPGQGNQQGRIILLARGPETILAYPSGVFNRTGNESLIDPAQGEYFSVSRFREVRAEFGPLPSTDAIHDVEIIILSQSGQLLMHKKLNPEAAQ